MMRQLLLILSIICITFPQLISQVISNVDFVQNDQNIEISYNLIGTDTNQKYDVTVFISKDGGLTFDKKPLTQVSGDVGQNITPGINKKIVWDVFNEQALEKELQFGDIVVFEVKAKILREEPQRQFFIGYKGSHTAPIGIIAGSTGKPGYYVSARFNPGFFRRIEYETDGTTPPSGWSFVSDVNKIQRLSITAGLQFKVSPNIHLFAGGGFSHYNLLWQIMQLSQPGVTDWVKNTSESFNSFEFEVGMMLQLQRFFLSVGLASPGFKWVDFTFSAGMFL